MLLRTAFIACLAGVVFTSAQRQCPGQVPRVIQLKPMDVSGTVAGVRAGLVTIKTPTGEMWGVQIPPGVTVRVTGKAYRDVLRPGLHVRFQAQIEKRRSLVQGKVDKLTIITPSKEDGRMPGAFPVAAPPQEVKSGDDASGQNDSTAGSKLDTFDIRARVVAFKGNWLTLHVPNEFFKAKLRVELAEQPEINLDVAEYSISKAGDALKARGVHVGPQLVRAREVHIELAKTLGEGKRRTTGKKPANKVPEESKPDEPGQPVLEKPNPDGNDPASNDPKGKDAEGKTTEDKNAEDTDTEKLTQFLKPKQGEFKGKPSLKLNLGGVNQEIFAPCTAETAKNLKAKFGKPKSLASASGKLPIGKDNAQQEVKWQLWDYGTVRILVDEVGDLRYFSVKQEEKKQ